MTNPTGKHVDWANRRASGPVLFPNYYGAVLENWCDQVIGTMLDRNFPLDMVRAEMEAAMQRADAALAATAPAAAQREERAMAEDNKFRVEKLPGAEGTPLPEDEPVFVLRAQDMLAADIVRQYAYRYRDAEEGELSPERFAAVRRILAIADRMEAWPVHKIPD